MSEAVILSAILGFFGLLITIVYNNFNSRLAKDRIQKELFTEFNERYDKLNDSLYKIQLECHNIEDLENNTDLKPKLMDFFNLCSEEFYWFYHKKRIDPIIWHSWQKGMNYWYNNVPVIKKMWENEMKLSGKLSYYITDKMEFFKDEICK
jgi:hypothetical protein